MVSNLNDYNERINMKKSTLIVLILTSIISIGNIKACDLMGPPTFDSVTEHLYDRTYIRRTQYMDFCDNPFGISRNIFNYNEMML